MTQSIEDKVLEKQALRQAGTSSFGPEIPEIAEVKPSLKFSDTPEQSLPRTFKEALERLSDSVDVYRLYFLLDFGPYRSDGGAVVNRYERLDQLGDEVTGMKAIEPQEKSQLLNMLAMASIQARQAVNR